jgi:hypothetical protein
VEWTDAEIEALPHYEYYTQWLDATGSTKSQRAWASRRFRDGTTGPPVPPPERPALPTLTDYASEGALWDAYKTMVSVQLGRADAPSTHEWTSPDTGWLGLVFLGDLHIGGLIDAEQLERDLDLIQRTDGLYAIGMGDYGERFQHSGKITHAMSGNPVPASDDQEVLVRYVLGRCGKWIAVLAGNHDDWGSEGVVPRLGDSLGCPSVGQAGCTFRVMVGAQRYILYLKHQYAGGGRGTSNDGKRFWNEHPDFENAHVTVLAHLHEPNTHMVERKGQTVIHLRGGTYKTVDPWARKGGYCPDYGPSIILLNPNETEVLAFHGKQWRHGVSYLTSLRGLA